MGDLQNGLPGPRAQRLSTVCKDLSHEHEPALILIQLMAVMTAWGWQKKIKIVLQKRKDASVK